MVYWDKYRCAGVGQRIAHIRENVQARLSLMLAAKYYLNSSAAHGQCGLVFSNTVISAICDSVSDYTFHDPTCLDLLLISACRDTGLHKDYASANFFCS